MTALDLDAIKARHAAMEAQEFFESLPAQLAYDSASDVPALVAEVGRLRGVIAEADAQLASRYELRPLVKMENALAILRGEPRSSDSSSTGRETNV